jgi:predicted nucleic acid-binding protein
VRRYLLDTAPLTAYLFGRESAVSLIGPWLQHHEATTSILVYGEITEYLMGRSDRSGRQFQLRRLLQQVKPWLLSYSILDRYAMLRRNLRPPQGPGLIGDIDTLIAATALDRGLTVVTTDSDFTRVPSLSVLLLDRQTLSPVRIGTTE